MNNEQNTTEEQESPFGNVFLILALISVMGFGYFSLFKMNQEDEGPDAANNELTVIDIDFERTVQMAGLAVGGKSTEEAILVVSYDLGYDPNGIDLHVKRGAETGEFDKAYDFGELYPEDDIEPAIAMWVKTLRFGDAEVIGEVTQAFSFDSTAACWNAKPVYEKAVIDAYGHSMKTFTERDPRGMTDLILSDDYHEIKIGQNCNYQSPFLSIRALLQPGVIDAFRAKRIAGMDYSKALKGRLLDAKQQGEG